MIKLIQRFLVLTMIIISTLLAKLPIVRPVWHVVDSHSRPALQCQNGFCLCVLRHTLLHVNQTEICNSIEDTIKESSIWFSVLFSIEAQFAFDDHKQRGKNKTIINNQQYLSHQSIYKLLNKLLYCTG